MLVSDMGTKSGTGILRFDEGSFQGTSLGRRRMGWITQFGDDGDQGLEQCDYDGSDNQRQENDHDSLNNQYVLFGTTILLNRKNCRKSDA